MKNWAEDIAKVITEAMVRKALRKERRQLARTLKLPWMTSGLRHHVPVVRA